MTPNLRHIRSVFALGQEKTLFNKAVFDHVTVRAGSKWNALLRQVGDYPPS